MSRHAKPVENSTQDDFGLIAAMFKINSEIVEKAIDSIPEDRWTEQPSPDVNHLTWISGHIVVMRALAARILGKEWNARWENLFARGVKLVSSEQYPRPEEIRKAWRETSEALSIALAAASPAQLSQNVEAGVPSLNGQVSGSIALLSLHETYHVGQLSLLRKWLGYSSPVG